MSIFLTPLFCLAAGFVVFLASSIIMTRFRIRYGRGGRSARRERRASRVVGVATALGFATVFTVGTALPGELGMKVGSGVLIAILLITIWLVWRIFTAPNPGR